MIVSANDSGGICFEQIWEVAENWMRARRNCVEGRDRGGLCWLDYAKAESIEEVDAHQTVSVLDNDEREVGYRDCSVGNREFRNAD